MSTRKDDTVVINSFPGHASTPSASMSVGTWFVAHLEMDTLHKIEGSSVDTFFGMKKLSTLRLCIVSN